MLKLLVIEDNPKHLRDAKKFFSSQKNVETVYTSNFEEAQGYLNAEKVDGVISDIYFPLVNYPPDYPMELEEPTGVLVMMICRQRGIPCILNTAGYHHGGRYNWICCLQRYLEPSEPEMVDASDDEFKEARTKDWKTALKKLKNLIN